MSAGTLLAIAWAIAVFVGAWRFATGPALPPERYRTLEREVDAVRNAGSVTGDGAGERTGPAGAAGAADAHGAGDWSFLRVVVRRLGDAVTGRVAVLRPLGSDLVGIGVVGVVVGTVVFGVGGLLAALGGVAALARRSARRRAFADRAESRDLAALVDVVALMVRSGLPLGVAIDRGCGAVDGAAPDGLGRLLRGGLGAETALRRWGATGTAERAALAVLLSAALRSGGAVADRLEARAQRMRHRRRHELLAEARRLPIRLLAPLVCCTLPSFVALTVVPLLVVSLDSMSPLL